MYKACFALQYQFSIIYLVNPNGICSLDYSSCADEPPTRDEVEQLQRNRPTADRMWAGVARGGCDPGMLGGGAGGVSVRSGKWASISLGPLGSSGELLFWSIPGEILRIGWSQAGRWARAFAQ